MSFVALAVSHCQLFLIGGAGSDRLIDRSFPSHCTLHSSVFIMMPFHHSRHMPAFEILTINSEALALINDGARFMLCRTSDLSRRYIDSGAINDERKPLQRGPQTLYVILCVMCACVSVCAAFLYI